MQGLSPTWCRSPDIGLPRPDLVLYLTISPTVAASRGGYGEERYEKAEVQRAVAVEFEKLGEGLEEWVRVDAEGTEEEVRRVIEERVGEVLRSEKLEGAVGKLWVDEE